MELAKHGYEDRSMMARPVMVESTRTWVGLHFSVGAPGVGNELMAVYLLDGWVMLHSSGSDTESMHQNLGSIQFLSLHFVHSL
jgi:hypothetical protein